MILGENDDIDAIHVMVYFFSTFLISSPESILYSL